MPTACKAWPAARSSSLRPAHILTQGGRGFGSELAEAAQFIHRQRIAGEVQQA